MKNSRIKIALLLVVMINFLIYGLFSYSVDENIINFALDKPYPVEQIDYAMTRMSTQYYDIEYSHMAGGHEIVYVKGHYASFAQDKLIKGRYIASGDYEAVLLSKDVASKMYKTYDCLGNTYYHEGRAYQVIGVLDTNGKTVFTLPERYQNNAQRVTLRIGVSEVQESQIALFRSWFRVKGIRVNNTLVNQWFIQTFRNIGIGLLMILLINEIVIQLYRVYGFMEVFNKQRSKEKLVFILRDYIRNNRGGVYQFIKDLVKLITFVFALLYIGVQLKIPTYLLPEDPTSLSLWVKVVDKLVQGFTYQLRFGMETVTIYTMGFAVFEIAFIGLIFALEGRIQVQAKVNK